MALACAASNPGWALIEYTQSQRETIVELVDQLEDRHYASRNYNDQMSSLHLDAYIEKLDRGKMYFTAADIADFEQYRLVMDDQLSQGKLDAGFNIFNRFQQRLESRLQRLLDTLPEAVASLDFTRDESWVIDPEDQDWARSDKELDDRWRKQLKNQVLGLKLAEKPADEIVPTLEKRYSNQLGRVKQYNSQDVFQIYANALTELYDPHTNYLSPRRSENFNINMRLSLEGIGAVLQTEDEYTKVARLVAKGPADKQGELQPSDRIVGVGQGVDGEFEDVIGWRLDEVVQLIRGPKGSTVRLEVIPAKAKSTDERRQITIVRNKVKLEEQSAQKKILEIPSSTGTIKVGVIDIPAFYIDFDAMRRGENDYKSTTRDVKRLLQELQEENVAGIVVDLRNNGGGSLQEANELTGLFIEYGPTVQIRHASRRVWRDGKNVWRDGKRLKSEYYEGPLVVLVNRLSASASEIFAGAIQDYQRGIIVGDRSFGKGTVQTLIPLTEGQLKITESKFYRISGDSTQHRGVVPDVEFPTLYNIDAVGESALDRALNWDKINPVRHRNYNDLSTVLPVITAQFEQRSGSNPDFVYLEDQAELARETRELKELPLNEKARIALRESQEARALGIENKRRKAKGEELLSDLENDEDEDAVDEDLLGGAREDTDDDDVLLREAGNILVDVLLLKNARYAVHERQAFGEPAER
ncbi:MAG: carboxy terminal-processing peptidase [Halioglobus sp.]|nr:carboxy terminal-processing peptidase [Halioglobus sp.]